MAASPAVAGRRSLGHDWAMADDLPADPAREPGLSPGQDELHALAARRRLSVDDHMFTAPGLPGTLRLQLFTAPRARPIAVATQIMRRGGEEPDERGGDVRGRGVGAALPGPGPAAGVGGAAAVAAGAGPGDPLPEGGVHAAPTATGRTARNGRRLHTSSFRTWSAHRSPPTAAPATCRAPPRWNPA